MSGLIKLVLGWVGPFLLPTLLGLLTSGGLLTTWWFDWIPLHSIILLGALGCLIYLYATASELPRLAYVAGMIGVAYLAGGFHEHDKQGPRIDAAKTEVHKIYKGAVDTEVAWLNKIKKELETKLVTDTAQHFKERADLRAARDKAIEEAKRVSNPDDTIFTVDDVDLLNRLRHDRRGTRIQGSGRKTKAR
jgi:hypothetical protein